MFIPQVSPITEFLPMKLALHKTVGVFPVIKYFN